MATPVDLSIVYVQADFKAFVDHVGRLSEAVGVLVAERKNFGWQTANNRYVIRDDDTSSIWTLDHTKLGFMSIRLAPFEKGTDDVSKTFASVLRTLSVERVLRMGLKVQSLVNLRMTANEIRELFFGSFLPHRENLPEPFKMCDDMTVELHGEHCGMNYIYGVTALDEEESRAAFKELPNLKAFAKDPMFDTKIAELLEMFTGEFLNVNVDLFRADETTLGIPQFLKTAYETAWDVIEVSSKHLKSLPASKVRK